MGRGRNLSAEIRRVSGVTVTGRYRRYKAKKWRYLGDSGAATSSGHGTLGVYAADFRNKHGTPYTFIVAVDVTARVITPIENLPETQRDAVEDWLDTAPTADPVPTPSPPAPPRVSSGPRRRPTVSVEEAHRGIYIDFEGTMKDPASLLGVLVMGDDGELEFDQPVFEEALWPAVRRARPTKPGGYAPREADVSDTFYEIRQRAEGESRRVFAYGHREIVEIRKRLPLKIHVSWWEENLINMLPLARAWTRRHHSDEGPTGQAGEHTLANLLRLIGYEVPKAFGPGNSAQRIRYVRDKLNKHSGNYGALRPTAKSKWTKACRHNWHDCEGMRELMIRCAQDIP